MKLLLALLTAAMAAVAVGQAAEPKDLFAWTRPDAMVQVHKDPLGPDIVTITMLDPKYPAEQLRAQVDRIGAELGGPPRGVQVFHYFLQENNPATAFWKANFAVEGAIDAQTGRLRVAPFVKAFAGVAAPFTVSGIGIAYDGVRATPQTLKRFASPAVQLDAKVIGTGVEYRARLLVQDPARIDIPDGAAPLANAAVAPVKKAPDMATWAIIGVAVVAAGALVYSLLAAYPARRMK